MRDDLIITCYIVSWLIVWFDTDAFVEYVKLLRIGKYFDIEEYEKRNSLAGGVITEYYEFLDLKYSNFLTKLLACPICTSFWLTIYFGTLSGNYQSFPLYFTGSTAAYLLIKTMFK